MIDRTIPISLIFRDNAILFKEFQLYNKWIPYPLRYLPKICLFKQEENICAGDHKIQRKTSLQLASLFANVFYSEICEILPSSFLAEHLQTIVFKHLEKRLRNWEFAKNCPKFSEQSFSRTFLNSCFTHFQYYSFLEDYW